MQQNKTPQHIAFIMDGNGRWAKKRALPRNVGHRKGVEALKLMIEECKKRGVGVVTFFAFSTENWKRPQDEIDSLFSMVKRFADKELKKYINDGYRVKILGDTKQLPQDTQDALLKITTQSKDNKGMLINIALNYGGRQEIVYAINRILQSGLKEVDEQMLSDCLWTAGDIDPDIIVRSSGEKRLSNFLLWQCAYSEFIFVDEHWPDFDAKILDRILEEYYSRDRRFGKLK